MDYWGCSIGHHVCVDGFAKLLQHNFRNYLLNLFDIPLLRIGVRNLLRLSKAQHCPGEICKTKDKHEIQKIKFMHILFVLGMVGFVVLMAFMFNDFFSIKPHDLFGTVAH